MSEEDIKALGAAHGALLKCDDDARVAFNSDVPLRFYKLAVNAVPHLLAEHTTLRTRAERAEARAAELELMADIASFDEFTDVDAHVNAIKAKRHDAMRAALSALQEEK